MEPLADLVEAKQRDLLDMRYRIRAWEEEGIRLAVLHGRKTLTLPVFGAPNPDWYQQQWDLSDPALVEKALRLIRASEGR